ncbi:MAG: phosphomannomutase/phosphoglucomutase [Bacilli bacterium]|nr:phosphomannomutase/phosphoglucomutase [Bacilli bacterium]
MELNKYMFREYDIRGVWGCDINEEVSYLIGKAFGTKLKRLGKIETLVGYDNRHSSPIIEENVVRGIRDAGINVTRLGLVTTPMYYYGWDFLNIKSGMMITASHNPKDDNGFKFSYNGIHNAYGESSLELYEMIKNNDFDEVESIGSIRDVNIRGQYIKMITEGIKLGDHKIKVVYDCGNGTTAIVADEIFNTFKDKLELVPLFNDSDGDFPNHHPDPAVEENLTRLKETVQETNADIGIAFDGDGDRVGVITNNSKFLDIDKYMILIWRDLIHKNVDKKTFYDVKCSLALKEELDKLGVQNEYFRTGNSYTKAKSYEGNFPFAGELSGHVFFRDRFGGYDDGIYAGLRLVEILTNTEKNIEELLQGIPEYISTPEIKIATEDNIKFKVIDKVREYAEDKHYNILTVDGVKVLYSDASALVRASNTGPNITTRFEAKNEEKLQEIKNEFLNLIDDIKSNL